MNIARRFDTILIRILPLCFAFIVAACGHEGGGFDPRDTVQVPEGITGEDSIAYIENAVIQSPISAEDLLNLAEIHTFDHWMEVWLEHKKDVYESLKETDMNKSELDEISQRLIVTHSDSCAIRLTNRFMRMHHVVDMNGDAMDKLQWAVAVNAIIDTFCTDVPNADRDSALNYIIALFNKFSPLNQPDMNLECYVESSIDYYYTIEAYRKWLENVPDNLKSLAQEEYKAWHDLNEARFSMWRDVSSTQSCYSAKLMEIEVYYQNLAENRRAELAVERDIVIKGQPYKQKGKTVTTKQWEKWIVERSRPEDYGLIMEFGYDHYLPSDSTVTECVSALKETFSRWLKARQALAAALPKDQGISYDNLTADIHSRIVGAIPSLIPYYGMDGEVRY